jgi:phage/conjugal plasmid C-4 type zinc finger TraR family protein
MADDIDRAQIHNERYQAQALDAWRNRQSSAAGRTYCIDCEEEIPLKRRTANPAAVRCIDCQKEIEARR